jgi:heat-inducible transcriptional repressor
MVMGQRKEARDLTVLTYVIRLYIHTARPVSSTLAAKAMGGNLSSATIRNIMAELEEAGYITQPHTSAGRVPTDHGYRKYVDYVKGLIRTEKDEMDRLSREYFKKARNIREIIERTSVLISKELHQASVIMSPNIGCLTLKRLEVIRIKEKTVLAVLVTITNAIRNYMIVLEDDIPEDRLEKVRNYINSNFHNKDITEIAESLENQFNESEIGEEKHTIKYAYNIVSDIVDQDMGNEIYWEGLDLFTEEPEFNDPDMVKTMIRLFSDRSTITGIMKDELPSRDIKIYIGSENRRDTFKDCSLITSGYGRRGKAFGRIGVLGPRRMDYENILNTVGYLSELISTKLEGFENER